MSQELATTPVVEGQKLENCFLCSIPFEALRPGLKVAFYNVPNLMQICKDNETFLVLNLAYLKYDVCMNQAICYFSPKYTISVIVVRPALKILFCINFLSRLCQLSHSNTTYLGFNCLGLFNKMRGASK